MGAKRFWDTSVVIRDQNRISEKSELRGRDLARELALSLLCYSVVDTRENAAQSFLLEFPVLLYSVFKGNCPIAGR